MFPLFSLGIDADDYRKLKLFKRASCQAFGLYWNATKMAKYGEHEARADNGQNEFSDIIKSRSGK